MSCIWCIFGVQHGHDCQVWTYLQTTLFCAPEKFTWSSKASSTFFFFFPYHNVTVSSYWFLCVRYLVHRSYLSLIIWRTHILDTFFFLISKVSLKVLGRNPSIEEISWIHLRIHFFILFYFFYIFQMANFFYLLSVLTQVFTNVLYRKIVNGMSGKLQFCRSAMLLKTYTDGLVGMILPHLYAMHVLKIWLES